MNWLAVCVLCALVEQAAFYDEADDDFDDAYDEDDFFTSTITVSKDYARRRRSDVTTSLNQHGSAGTPTRRNEYDDTEADQILTNTVLPLTMLPIAPDHPTTSTKLNTANPRSSRRAENPNVINLYPKPPRTSENLNIGITPHLDNPTRSPNPKTDSNTDPESLSPDNPSNDNANIDAQTKSANPTELTLNPATKTSRKQNDLTIYPDLPTRSTNSNTDVATYVNPTRSPNPNDLTTQLKSTNTETTPDTVSTIFTLPATQLLTSNSSLLTLPVGYRTPITYRTVCEDCESTFDALRVKYIKFIGTPPPETTLTPLPPLPPVPVNVPLLLQLIDNLTINYDWNLTRRFNESLQRYKIPTCPPWTTVTVTTEAPTTNNFENASLISKCFVCGLKTPGVPYDSRCADAFSGDFIPLVPVDAKARGFISRYRKYCRYLDVNGVLESPFEPHSVFGRFTGGCSVRWVDLTGVYTQRACRNRRRPVLGKHFGSKRMAKLEMALKDVDNGCIISPVATLLPLSRGISLYARFHACVCSGSWCNRAVQIPSWTTNFTILSMLIIVKIVN